MEFFMDIWWTGEGMGGRELKFCTKVALYKKFKILLFFADFSKNQQKLQSFGDNVVKH